MAEELAQTEKKILDLESVIRTETVLSKLPFHNLSKKETIEILVKRDKTRDIADGTALITKGDRPTARLDQYDLYWSVHPNPKYGEPRQLAYDIDKLVIDKRLDEMGKPYPRRMKLGSLQGIARELGRSAVTSGSEIKRALLQNSSAYITLKISYTDLDGVPRTAADHNTRYGVSFRGAAGPDGTKNEAVFITWNDPFLEILNNTKTRPMDYAYLKALPPTARRWYELISYLFYATSRNHQRYAEVRYSEYCKLAPQKRLMDRHKAQTQMGKIHRYHLASGYLARAEYCSTTDADGNRDWIIRYYPGPAASEEYEAFKPGTLKALYERRPVRIPSIPQPDANGPPDARIEANTAPLKSVPGLTPITSDPVEDLMRHWRNLKGYPVDGPVPARDRATCASLLNQLNGDLAIAQAAIDLALEENPDARNIAFALQNSYPQRAVTALEAERLRAAQAEERKRAAEAFEKEKAVVEEKAKDNFYALPAEEREGLVGKTRQGLQPFINRGTFEWTPERIEASALHTYVTDALDRWLRARFRGTQETDGGSSETPR